jgi:hypothetical protein
VTNLRSALFVVPVFAVSVSTAGVSRIWELSFKLHSRSQLDSIAGATCTSPPQFHCPDTNCSSELIMHSGNARDARTRRAFFLDYPCDLRPGEAVTFVLSLHGGGMIGNWHRHYFPLMDFKEKYRLVIATPTATNSLWNPENDDGYLRNIVSAVYERIGEKNIKAFWIAGHSHGGFTANRLLMNPFYRQKLTGWVSLSGGRLGSRRAYAPTDSKSAYMLPSRPGLPPASRTEGSCSPAVGVGLGDTCSLPDYDISHIYTSGEYELTAQGLPDHSVWAQRLGCKSQTRRTDVVDRRAGYVWDSRSPRTRNTWAGRKPRPGRAQVFVYPACKGGQVVADVIRLDKGHTEGLEPKVTEEIIRLMLSAGRG